MNWKIRTVTAPTVEPVTATTVKLHTHISHSTEDTLIESWIKAGRKKAEGIQHRAFITQTLELFLDEWPGSAFYIPRPPLQSIVSFKYYGTDDTEYSLTENTDFYKDIYNNPGRICLEYGKTWPSTTLRDINGIIIQYKAGYGDAATAVPDTVKNAITLFCAYQNENRAGEIIEMPRHIKNLLRPDAIKLIDLNC